MTTPRFELPEFPPRLPFLLGSQGKTIDDLELARHNAERAYELIDEANGLFPIPMTNDALKAINRVHEFLNDELRRRRAAR